MIQKRKISLAGRAEPFRPGVLSVAMLGLCVWAWATSALAENTDELFEKFELVTGASSHQTILAGFFLDGATAELAVLHIDEQAQRRLRMYGLKEGAWVPVLEAMLHPGVLFVDVASINGRDRLITYHSGRLNWFDPETLTDQALVAISTHFTAVDAGEIPHVDITRDVNHDGRDDVLMPDFDGFMVAIQSSGGSFAEPVKLGPPEPMLDETGVEDRRPYRETGITAATVPWYLSRVHEMDYDQDGRSDLVFWNKDHFDVYYQNDDGLFDPVAVTVAAEVPFDADGVYSLHFGYGNKSTVSLMLGFRKKTERTVLHSVRDINGDGVADLVTQTVTARSLLKQRSVYAVHFGEAEQGGTRFAKDPGALVRPQGSPGEPVGYAAQWLQDLDGNGRVDLGLQIVKTGIGGMARALAASSIAVDLEAYLMEDNVYPDTPNVVRKIRPKLKLPLGRGPFFPTVLLGDVNGDGRTDLLVGENAEALDVYLGVPGSNVFAAQSHTVAVALTANEKNARLTDLNKDGKQDVLIHHPSDTEPHHLITLIAR